MAEARAVAANGAKFNSVTLDWCKKALDQILSHFGDWFVALEYGRSAGHIIQDQVGKAKVLPP